MKLFMPKHKTELDKMFNEFEIHNKNKEAVRDLFYQAGCVTRNLKKPPRRDMHFRMDFKNYG